MKEVHYFIAEDGTRFDDEYECSDYEFDTSVAPKMEKCRAFNSHIKPVPLSPDFVKNERMSTFVSYLYIGDEIGFNAINECYHRYGYVAPDDSLTFNGPMFLCYDDCEDCWKDLEAIIHSYQNQIGQMKEGL